MSDRTGLRLGAAAGIMYVILQFLGFGITAASVGALTSIGSSDADLTAAFQHPTASGAWVGLYIGVLAFLLFVVFLARLWATLRRAEGEQGWISAVAFGSGLLFVALSLVSLVFIGVQRLAAGGGIDLQLARVLTNLTSGLHTLSWGVAALFLAASAVVVLRTAALPRWLGWSGAIISVGLLLAMAAPAAELAPLAGFLPPLWIVATSIALLRHSELPLDAINSGYVSQPSTS